MTQEIDITTENTINDVDKIFTISGIALSGLALIFYPIEDAADMTETDLGFVGTITKVVSGLGLIGTLWSVGLLYHREIQIPPILKWILVPLLILDVLLVTALIALLALGTSTIIKIGNLAIKYVKPAICSLGAIGLIIAMAVVPEKLLKMSLIGKTIHYLPAALGYPPINKHPFYLLVIVVRTGGLITTLAGNIIDVATEEKEEDNSDEQKQLES